MKNVLFFAFCLFAISAIGQVKLPAPSPGQYLKQDFGVGNIEIKYSRPAVKDRVIFGDLVPFGKVWRTGANSNTTIRFSDPVTFNGQKLDSGTYSLYTVPNVDKWEVRLNKTTSNWGASGYSDSADVLRTIITPKKLKDRVESFTISIDDVAPETCNLVLTWDKTQIRIPLTTSFRDKVRADVEKALNGEKKPYWAAAQFYNEYDKNPKKALEMTNLAVEANPNQYWVWLYKARLEAALGDHKKALESSKRSLQLATEAKNDDYIKLNKDFQKTLKK